MNWKDAQKQAIEIMPEKHPSRLSSVCTIGARNGIILVCHDEPAMLVIANKADLYTIKGAIDFVLAHWNEVNEEEAKERFQELPGHFRGDHAGK